MLQTVTDVIELERYQNEFVECLKLKLPQEEELLMGHQSNSYKLPVFTDGELWFSTRLVGDPKPTRYWNVFGLYSMKTTGNMIVEVNFPLQGLNRHIAGVFVRDTKTDEILILHRGRVGGGRKGIGMSAFLAWTERISPESLIEFGEGKYTGRKCILLGKLHDDSLFDGIYIFVKNVRDFKDEMVGR